MMGMSKAFYTVTRSLVMDNLEQILEPDELQLIKILIKDVQLSVKINGETGTVFKNQGLSLILWKITQKRRPARLISLQYAEAVAGWVSIIEKGSRPTKPSYHHSWQSEISSSTKGRLKNMPSVEGWRCLEDLTVHGDSPGYQVWDQEKETVANGAMNRMKPNINDQKLKLAIKIRVFTAYMTSIFWYNSETWTLPKQPITT